MNIDTIKWRIDVNEVAESAYRLIEEFQAWACDESKKRGKLGAGELSFVLGKETPQ